jgi:hypothetical protein
MRKGSERSQLNCFSFWRSVFSHNDSLTFLNAESPQELEAALNKTRNKSYEAVMCKNICRRCQMISHDRHRCHQFQWGATNILHAGQKDRGPKKKQVGQQSFPCFPALIRWGPLKTSTFSAGHNIIKHKHTHIHICNYIYNMINGFSHKAICSLELAEAAASGQLEWLDKDHHARSLQVAPAA